MGVNAGTWGTKPLEIINKDNTTTPYTWFGEKINVFIGDFTSHNCYGANRPTECNQYYGGLASKPLEFLVKPEDKPAQAVEHLTPPIGLNPTQQWFNQQLINNNQLEFSKPPITMPSTIVPESNYPTGDRFQQLLNFNPGVKP